MLHHRQHRLMMHNILHLLILRLHPFTLLIPIYYNLTPHLQNLIPNPMTSWYTGQHLAKPLDKLLVTLPSLSALLDYPDFIAELKAFNSHLLEYLSQTTDLIRQAVQYIMVPPKESDSQDRKYKYPILSAEMFETEAVCLANNFFKDSPNTPGSKTYLDYLYQQLEQPQLLDLCAGYFYRVNLVLLNLKFKQFVEHMYSRPQVFKKLLNHTYNSSITNSLQIILNLDNTKVDKTSQEAKGMKTEAMRMIFSKIRYDTQGETLSNLSNVLIEVIEKYYLIADGKILLDVILEKENIELIFDLGQSNNPFINSPMLNVLVSIINYYSFSSFNSEEKGNNELNKKNMDILDKQPLLQALSNRFQRLLSMFTSATKLNPHLFKILEVLCHSISLSSSILMSTIKRTKFFQSLLQMLFKHQECNIAHTLIQRAFLHIFVSEKSYYQQHKLYLFCEMNIIKRTVSGIVGEKFEVLKSKPFFGHLMRIIKIYSNIQTTNDNIIHSIRDNSELWGRVAKEIIKPYEEICSKDLGSYNIPFAPALEFKVKIAGEIPIPTPVKSEVSSKQYDEEYMSMKTSKPEGKTTTSAFENDEEQFRSSLGKESKLKNFMTQIVQNLGGTSSTSTTTTKKTVKQIYNEQKERQAQNTINKSSSQSNLPERKNSMGEPGNTPPLSRSYTPDPKELKKIKVKKLEIFPSQKLYRKIDERDATLMNLLGIEY